MKAFLVLSALIAMTLVSCTFQSKPGGGHVVIQSQRVLKAKDAPGLSSGTATRALLGKHLPRTRSVPGARNLSANDDVVAVTYTVYHWVSAAWVNEGSGDIDLFSLSTELLLQPSETYRIVVDVEITDTAPGTNVGVTRYGDQADFVVDPDYDTYVNLTVHPSQALVFDPTSVVAGTPSKVKAFDPSVSGYAADKGFYTGTLTTNQADKFFYGPDATLYYFNKTANSIYLWPNIASPMSASDLKVSGTTSFDTIDDVTADTTVTMYAACADPNYEKTLFVIGSEVVDVTDDDVDNPKTEFFYYALDVSGGTPVVSRSSAITADLEYNLTGTITAVPTGIAVDTTYRDVYVTFRSSDADSVESGVLQFYNGDFYAQFPDPTTFTDEFSSIYTDVVWEQGKAWVTLSPNTSMAALSGMGNTGKANIRVFNDYLQDQGYDTGSVTYTGGSLAVSGATSLVLPNRFLGPIQGTKVYLSQQDFLSGGTSALSELDLDTTDVVSY